MSEKSKEKLATKVQKACRTRQLSLDKSVESVCLNLPALLQTLRWYQNKDSNPTAIGLLEKLKKPNFIGVLYVLKGVLPCSRLLVRCFKRASYLFLVFLLPSKHLKIRLTGLFKKKITVKEFRKETTTGKLAFPEFSEDKIEATEAKMYDLCSQYVTALTDNIDQRFQHSLAVVSSFLIFDPLSVPIAYCKPRVCKYGQNDIQTLANHFLVEIRTAANALNWKLNRTTSSISCLTGVRTIRLFLRLLQLPQNGSYRGS